MLALDLAQAWIFPRIAADDLVEFFLIDFALVRDGPKPLALWLTNNPRAFLRRPPGAVTDVLDFFEFEPGTPQKLRRGIPDSGQAGDRVDDPVGGGGFPHVAVAGLGSPAGARVEEWIAAVAVTDVI